MKMRISKTQLLQRARQTRYDVLAEQLNSEGYTTNRGRQWTVAAVGAQVCRYRKGVQGRTYTPRTKRENTSSVDALLDAITSYQEAKKNLMEIVKRGEF
jgi:hypothetical protein